MYYAYVSMYKCVNMYVCTTFSIHLLKSLYYILNYTGIYAEGYIVFVFPFVRSYVRSFVLSLVHSSVAFVEFTSKFNVKSSQMGHILPTTDQKASIFGLWISWKVCFHAMSLGPRVHAPGLGWRSNSRTPLECVFLLFCYRNNLCR